MWSARVIPEDGATEHGSPWLLWGIWIFWMFFLAQPIAVIVSAPNSFDKLTQFMGLLLFCGIYMWTTWREAYRLTRLTPLESAPDRLWWLGLILLLALATLISLREGALALGSFIYVSASGSGRLPFRWMVIFVVALDAMVALLGAVTGSPLAAIAQFFFIIPAVATIIFFFNRAVRTNQALRLARREIARLAVSEERLRFARDLHDLLGHTLSLITLKSELAGQLIGENPEQARREVNDIEAASRAALLEVREAVAGYRQTTLADETQRAQEILRAAGIACETRDDAGALPGPVEATLSWVVREGVTNMIRHSHATRCAITILREGDTARLTITDDGAAPTSATAAPGNGLRGIVERVARLGGYCEYGPAPERGFRLSVVTPLRLSEGHWLGAAPNTPTPSGAKGSP